MGTFLENEVHLKKSDLSKNFITVRWSPIKIFTKDMERFNQFSTMKKYFEDQNYEIFEKVVHNFGKFDNYMIT